MNLTFNHPEFEQEVRERLNIFDRELTVADAMLVKELDFTNFDFKDEDIDCSRYSLSTKAADALASGATILTYGSPECGIIEYMQSTGASFVCTEKALLVDTIKQMLERTDLQREYYDQQIVMTREHHNIEASCATVERIIKNTIAHGK